MKREVDKFLIIFVLTIILIGFVSADGCSIMERDDCNDYIVMGLSGQTNAHGQLNGQTPEYEWVLCCDFGNGDTDCTEDTNKILSLSALTNAHGQLASEENFI